MKTVIARIPLQHDKLEAISSGGFDHVDAYECLYEPEMPLDACDAALAFVAYRPSWFKALMKLRNTLVKPFGLRTGQSTKEALPTQLVEGEKLMFFTIDSVCDRKVVLFAEDSHLDTQLIFDTSSNRLLVITTVHFRNVFGRLYFAAIFPFHAYIVRKFAVHTVRQLLSRVFP